MVILIDNGHGEDTKGKCSPDALHGMMESPYWLKEWKWTREVAAAVVQCLQAEGYTAHLLVKEDRDVPLKDRCNRVRAYCDRYGKDNVILVSVHVNAIGDGIKWMTVRGWQIHTSTGVTKSDRLAACIWNVAKEEFRPPLKVRSYEESPLGHDFENDFYILKNTPCPAVLIENFFQDNKDDVAYIRSDKGKGSCIHVIVQGIEDYLKNT